VNPQQRLLLETAYQAMESSGCLSSGQIKESGDRIAVFTGASFTDYLEHTTSTTPNAYTATENIKAFLSGKISHHFGWTGPSEVIDTACSSSLVAISRGVRAVQRGDCTAALVGGVNFMSTPTHTLDLGRASFLSPTGQCKPFDESAHGYCRSEGVGLIVLKPLSEALANNDHKFGVIPGISTNQGSDMKSITVPSSTAHLQLYTDILKESKIDPSLITYVEAHGTGTQVGDPIESKCLKI
jgi:acyl transferase domain-containing protein